MADQMSLFGRDATPALFEPEVIRGRPGRLSGYNLFLAIVPLLADAERFTLAGAELRKRHRLQGSCLRTRNLHMSLHAIAGYGLATPIPRAIVDAALAAAAGVACPPPPIAFDRARSFGKPDAARGNAFVLRCDALSEAAAVRLRQALAVALRRSGLSPSRPPPRT